MVRQMARALVRCIVFACFLSHCWTGVANRAMIVCKCRGLILLCAIELPDRFGASRETEIESTMTPGTRDTPPPESGFEFELTDFASAREALDDASIELAAEAARPADPSDWVKRRRPLVPTDRALSGETIDWMLRLPAALRPHRLADSYPRLANQIAAAWGNRERCMRALSGLLHDSRGGRRGLPFEQRREVEALHQHLARPVG